MSFLEDYYYWATTTDVCLQKDRSFILVVWKMLAKLKPWGEAFQGHVTTRGRQRHKDDDDGSQGFTIKA